MTVAPKWSMNMVMTAMSFKELEVNTRYGASFSIMYKILLEKSNLSGRNNISEEQAAPDWLSVCLTEKQYILTLTVIV